MAYKKLIKVSNVCQLLDKRTYPETQTVYGVTFTNNGDGSITIDGTSTNQYYSAIGLEIETNKLVPGHTYIFTKKEKANNVENILLFLYPGSYITKYSNNIFVLPEHEYTRIYVSVRVNGGATVSNVTTKPQLFDLTEMYGAGHEPTTVEQFRQDFPEEMYDYSPYCWLTSYKRVFMTGGGNYLTSYQRNLTCKTKNLFNPLGREDANPTGNWPITKYDVGNVIYRGFAYSGYYQLDETYKCDVTVSGTVINVVQKLRSYGIGYIVKCNPDTVYTLSYKTNFSTIVSIFLDLEGNKLGYNWNRTFTTPNNAYYLLLSFASETAETYFIKNLQVELGDTATDYVPYGHL